MLSTLNPLGQVALEDLTALVARKNLVKKTQVLTFADFTSVVADCLNLFYRPSGRLICAGAVPAQVAQAAERIGMTLDIQDGASPFAGDINAVLTAVQSSSDVIFVANPNRLTAANFSLAELAEMAEAIPDGCLIVDEYYYDFFGISALPLLQRMNNLIILRSFTAAFSVNASEAGFAIASELIADNLRNSRRDERISPTVRKTIMAAMANTEAMQTRLAEVHEESLRVSTELTRLGVQTRICATDYLLLRVADPKAVAEHLTKLRIPVDNLDVHPGLEHYLRYQIRSPLSNDTLLTAVTRIPANQIRAKGSDRRPTAVRKPEIKTSAPAEESNTNRRLDIRTLERMREELVAKRLTKQRQHEPTT